MRVLVVEDEPKIATALVEGLGDEGYEAVLERTGEDAFFRVSTESFDLILLDLTLPGRDGLDILMSMRHSGVMTPVLVLTARDSLEARVAGLDCGADDYLVKPFAFAELLARIRALSRRGVRPLLKLSLADLELDVVSRTVNRAGTSVDLTTREFELLQFLMRHAKQVVSRETLMRDVWKETARTPPLDNVIDVHVLRLRRKLDIDGHVRLLHTVRGVGFMLSEAEP
jgi:DNA-binding response OmpR family regulator